MPYHCLLHVERHRACCPCRSSRVCYIYIVVLLSDISSSITFVESLKLVHGFFYCAFMDFLGLLYVFHDILVALGLLDGLECDAPYGLLCDKLLSRDRGTQASKKGLKTPVQQETLELCWKCRKIAWSIVAYSCT